VVTCVDRPLQVFPVEPVEGAGRIDAVHAGPGEEEGDPLPTHLVISPATGSAVTIRFTGRLRGWSTP
jgi:hypothetical protein